MNGVFQIQHKGMLVGWKIRLLKIVGAMLVAVGVLLNTPDLGLIKGRGIGNPRRKSI
jgi:hypothetical protein